MSVMADAPLVANSIASMSDRTTADSNRASMRDLIAATRKAEVAAFGSLVDLH